jgi:hypothetical protein
MSFAGSPLRTFVPPNQWPVGVAFRRQLAHHLVVEMTPAVDLGHLLELLAAGLTFECENGILRSGTGVMFQASLGGDCSSRVQGSNVVVYAQDLVALGFHAVYVAYRARLSEVPCMLFQCYQRAADPSRKKYYGALYSHVSLQLTPPPAVQHGFEIGRPDLQYFVMVAYMAWLKRVKRPELIEEALQLLLGAVWDYDTATVACQDMQRWARQGCVQMAVVANREVITSKGVVYSKATRANISLDTHDVLVASRRDRTLLAMRHLFDAESGWAVHGLPRKGRCPAVFFELQLQQPYLFDATLAVPACLFDEVDYLTAEACTVNTA